MFHVRVILMAIRMIFGVTPLALLKGELGGKPLNECEDRWLLAQRLERTTGISRLGDGRYREEATGAVITLIDCDKVRIERQGQGGESVSRTLTVQDARWLVGQN